MLAWEGLRTAAIGGLWISNRSHINDRSDIETSIAKIAGGYRPRNAGESWPNPTVDYFYLDNGLVKLPYEQDNPWEGQEVVRLNLQGLDVQFKVRTDTVAEPEKTTVLEGLHKMLPIAVEAGISSVTPAKYGSRTVAGLKGEELILRDSSEHELSFRWAFPGEVDSEHRPNIHRPKIELDMEGKTEGDSEKKVRQLWDALLDSMRPTIEAR